MKKIAIFLLIAPLILTGCVSQNKPIKQDKNQDLTNQNRDADINQEQTGLANPASVYCEKQGGRLEIRSDSQGAQTGFCVFADDSECEEWAFFRAECQPQSQIEDISGDIKQLFVEKYNKSSDEVSVTISQQTTDYARGGVKFGLGGIGEGGIFLAAKVDGVWQLVFDGNGIVDCSLLEDYDFPDSMSIDCFDY